MEVKQATTYSIEQVFLSKSAFHREPSIDFTSLHFKQETIVDHSNGGGIEPDSKFMVQVTVKITGTVEENEVISIEVTSTGVFQRHGESPLDEESFKKVNAPAIIYPFVREHIATVAVKGGIGSLLLPPINFTVK
jgi:preprotein translocase subunit SecB